MKKRSSSPPIDITSYLTDAPPAEISSKKSKKTENFDLPPLPFQNERTSRRYRDNTDILFDSLVYNFFRSGLRYRLHATSEFYDMMASNEATWPIRSELYIPPNYQMESVQEVKKCVRHMNLYYQNFFQDKNVLLTVRENERKYTNLLRQRLDIRSEIESIIRQNANWENITFLKSTVASYKANFLFITKLLEQMKFWLISIYYLPLYYVVLHIAYKISSKWAPHRHIVPISEVCGYIYQHSSPDIPFQLEPVGLVNFEFHPLVKQMTNLRVNQMKYSQKTEESYPRHFWPAVTLNFMETDFYSLIMWSLIKDVRRANTQSPDYIKATLGFDNPLTHIIFSYLVGQSNSYRLRHRDGVLQPIICQNYLRIGRGGASLFDDANYVQVDRTTEKYCR